MRERPILFSGPMVQALLARRKTQTRRVVKAQPSEDRWGYWNRDNGRGITGVYGTESDMRNALAKNFCPYGQPGDRLWVREAFAHVHPLQVAEGRFSLPSSAGIPGPPPVQYRTIYRADGEYNRLHFSNDGHPYRELCSGESCTLDHIHPEESWHGWSPSIHMPRNLSRITLEITEVRVQRLQDISEEDARAEGVEEKPRFPGFEDVDWWRDYLRPTNSLVCARDSFSTLWRSINGECSWEANPWVWAVSFKVLA